jgi:penicillin-binding protein 1A
VLDMAGAYSAFANGGLKATPYAIQQIAARDGTVLYDHSRDEPAPERVLPQDVAYQMNDALTAVVEAGTGGRAKLEKHRVAGKTGTTQAYRDAWFVGFTGWYTAAVWFGNDDYTSTNNMTGGSLPAMTWQTMMTVAHQNLVPKPIPGVGGLETEVAEAAPAETPAEAAPAVDRNLLTRDAIVILNQTGLRMRERLIDPPAALAPSAEAPVMDLGNPAGLAAAADRIGGVTLVNEQRDVTGTVR